MSVKSVSTDKAPAAIGPYSQAIVAGGFIFCAGQIPLDPATGQLVTGDITVQTKRVLDNLEAVLAAAGATWNDVVKTTVFIKDFNDFATINDIYSKALGDARPARSTVEVSKLPRGVGIEIDAIAVKK